MPNGILGGHFCGKFQTESRRALGYEVEMAHEECLEISIQFQSLLNNTLYSGKTICTSVGEL